MIAKWAGQLATDRPQVLSLLYGSHAGVKIRDQGGSLWLCGQEMDDQLEGVLCRLPIIRYRVQDNLGLVEHGSRVPHGFLPQDGWIPYEKWAQIKLPPAAFAGVISDRVPIRLERTSIVSNCNVLVTCLAELEAFANTAAEVRFRGLVFAVSASKRAIVCGNPLPTLVGQHFVEENGIAIQAGWTVIPRFDSLSLSSACRRHGNDLVLIQDNGRFTRIPGECFVPLSRSAIRITGQTNE